MNSKNSFAKTSALIGGAILLAAAVQAQVSRGTLNGGNADDFGWSFLNWQVSASTGGGTTTGTTGGNGGVITGGTPRPITTVVVIDPAMFPGAQP